MVFTRSGGPVPMPTLDTLPLVVLERVFRNLPYKEVAKIRVVSTRMNDVIKNYLSHSFQQMQNTIGKRCQSLRNTLPRRDSVRRMHPLSNRLHILDGINDQMGCLKITLEAALVENHYHFFAAEVLDEAERIMNYVAEGSNRPYYEITDEFYDLISMAQDYFKEKIQPMLPTLHCNYSSLTTPVSCDSDSEPSTSATAPESRTEHPEMKKAVQQLMKSMKRKRKELSELKHNYKKATKIVDEQGKLLAAMTLRIEESEKKSTELAAKVAFMDQEFLKLEHGKQPNLAGCPNLSLKRKSTVSEESGSKKSLMTE